MKVIIKGTVLAKQSTKFARRGKFVTSYQPKKVINWVAQARMQVLEQLPERFKPLDGDIIIKELKFIFYPLKNWSKKKLIEFKKGKIFYKNTRPDLDNICKATWDCCNGVLWTDDSRIVKIENMSKEFGEIPCIIMEVENELE